MWTNPQAKFNLEAAKTRSPAASRTKCSRGGKAEEQEVNNRSSMNISQDLQDLS
jgi:hypothetical protein